MPSCEFPARRITASLMFCGRRSALPTTGVGAEANSRKAEGVLTTKLLNQYRDRTAFVNKQPASARRNVSAAGRNGSAGRRVGGSAAGETERRGGVSAERRRGKPNGGAACRRSGVG